MTRLVVGLQTDVLALGTVGRAGLSGSFIGDTAEAMLQKIRCSVLAVKPEDFITPVAPAENGGAPRRAESPGPPCAARRRAAGPAVRQ